MPASLTFGSLQTTLAAYLERGTSKDLTVLAQLPFLINNAERRISRGLKFLGFQRPLINNFTAGSAVLPKPDRWRQTISFNYGKLNLSSGQYTQRTPLYARTYEFIRRFTRDDSTVGAPRYYADYDFNNWVVAPTPDQAYPFEVMFWEMPALLDTTNQTNWITQYAPDVLLYSSLLECAPFLKNDERMATWQGLFDAGMKSLSQENIQDLVSRASETRQSVGAS